MTYSKGNRTAGFSNAEKDRKQDESDTRENSRDVDNHLKAAEQFAEASRYHYEAAKLHTEGQHALANQAAFFAIGHSSKGMNYQVMDAKHHAGEK
jgi:hypothetical protein